MNFGLRYLIKWGILGWTYLAAIMAYFTLTDYETVKSVILSKDLPIIVSLLAFLIGSGIILGNLIHQFSLSFGFIIWTKRNKYFKNEYEINSRMMVSGSGKEIHRVYCNKLGKIEDLRALCFSLLLSWITLAILALTITFSIKVGILILGVMFLNWIVLNNWVFYQNNLDYFIKKIKSEFE